MRLAPTVGYDHWDLDGYNALRSYGMAGRPVLEGEDLTISNIEADYRLASDGTVLDLSEFELEEWEVAEYLAARTRKLTLSDQMLETVSQPGYENFHVLIGIDDSSVEDSIQKNEIGPICAASCGREMPCYPVWMIWRSRQCPGCIWTRSAGRGPM